MSTVGQIEKKTQARVVKLFRERLCYDYLGDKTDLDNRNIEETLLRDWLTKQGVSDTLISRALHELTKAAGDTSKSIYDRNKEVYDLLRYGIKAQPGAGENRVTVWPIDWKHPENNHFAIAEEVTVKGADLGNAAKAKTKRPDVVIYINGIAIGVLELKRSTVSVAEGTVSGIRVEVIRKDIKNLHLGVYPPNGRVRIAAPLVVSNEAVRLAVIDKLGWIKRQKAKFAEQPRQSQREMVNGESHYFLGKRYRLRVHEQDAPARVAVRGIASLDLFVRPGTSAEQRETVLLRWHREQLKVLIPPLLEKWQPILGVQVAEWGIKKMKTKWGSCNPISRRLWFNLELAKKPVQCLEYIVVHGEIRMAICRQSHQCRIMPRN